MTIFVTTFFFVFGAIIGSFLNVIILRYNTGLSQKNSIGFSGRSRCFSCGKNIKWYDLIPVLSFMILNGRCRHCKSKISFQYPLVELCAGFLFSGIFWKFFLQNQSTTFSFADYLLFSITLVVFSALIVITAYDLRHKIIPDLFVFLFGVLALVHIFISVPLETLFRFPSNLFYFLAGPIIAIPFFLIWLVSRGRWMGLGDAKLALGIGWFLGLVLGVSAVVIGVWIGAVVSIFLLLLSKLALVGFARSGLLSFPLKNLTMRSEIPLGPFLILGFVTVYFFQLDVTGLSTLSM